MICTLSTPFHSLTQKHLCWHSNTKILRNGPRVHSPFSLAELVGSLASLGYWTDRLIVSPASLGYSADMLIVSPASLGCSAVFVWQTG
jgi:hypothetical protein